MELKPGMLVERTYGEGRRPIGIIIAVPTSSRLGEWWIVEWAGSGKRDVMSSRYLKLVS
jgi:hypothetical protein